MGNECDLCKDLSARRTQVVNDKGNIKSSVLIVGQNPGADEDIAGEPFIGRAGKLLDNIIQHAGYSPTDDFYYTNGVKCHTQHNALPTDIHMQNCSPQLRNLIHSFDNIITIGKFALNSVIMALEPRALPAINLQPMYKLLTTKEPYVVRNKNIFITYHTSYLLRQGVNNNDSSKALYMKVSNAITLAKEYNNQGDTNATN